jgi:hypothetical protein
MAQEIARMDANERLKASVPFRSGHNRARFAMATLALYVLVSLISVASSYMQVNLLERIGVDDSHVVIGEAEEEEGAAGTISDQEAAANDLREMVVGLMMLAVLLACMVAYLTWLYRAYSNLPALGNSRNALRYSPGWAIGSWFIPLANVFIPYQIVKETWEKSDPGIETETDLQFTVERFSPLILGWWLLWIASNVVGRLSASFANRAKTPADLSFASKLDIAASLVGIAAAIPAIFVIREIDRRQEMRSLQVAYVPPAPPAPPTFAQPADNAPPHS